MSLVDLGSTSQRLDQFGYEMTVYQLRAYLKSNPMLRTMLHPAIVAKRATIQYKQNIRTEVLRNLAKYLAEDPILNLPEFDGVFAVDCRSDLFARIASYGFYEPRLAACCRKYLNPALDAIDVGANVGFYSNLMAKSLKGRRILAIEPTKNALARLATNLARNCVQDSVTIYEGVASDENGYLEINSILGKEEYSSLSELVHPSTRGQPTVKASVASSTLDSLVKEHGLRPGFIKIDVEGAEYRVLKGGQESLSNFRPVILSELSNTLLVQNGSSADQVMSFVRSLGYRLVDPLDLDVDFVPRDFGDMLCLPA